MLVAPIVRDVTDVKSYTDVKIFADGRGAVLPELGLCSRTHGLE